MQASKGTHLLKGEGETSQAERMQVKKENSLPEEDRWRDKSGHRRNLSGQGHSQPGEHKQRDKLGQ
jgi:hypothetical protein